MFNQWICIKTKFTSQVFWVEGQLYYFHEDAPPPSDYFVLVVDENDLPIKVRVRG